MMRCLLCLLLVLTACARATWYAPLTLPPDTLPLGVLPTAGKYVFRGPVAITQQLGNHNVASATATGKTKGAAVAIGPAASAAATQRSLPWWVFALVGVLSIAGWEWLTAQLKVAAWLPWRVKPD